MKAIYIVPIGTIDADIIQPASISIWHTFGLEVSYLDPMEAPPDAYDEKRKQFSSIDLLRMLHSSVRKETYRVMALTDKDLFIPVLSFVYGHAQFEGKVGIVSIARLRQEFYGFPEDRPLLVARTVKEVIHETGHLFGLTHCSNSACPMTLSTNIRALDQKGTSLCDSCKILLKENMAEKYV